MIFKPFYYYDLGCAAYLLGCGTPGKCAVVDPRVDDVDAYMAFASAKQMRITHVIDTHVHADHRSGGVELARRSGARYCLHESADVRICVLVPHHFTGRLPQLADSRGRMLMLSPCVRSSPRNLRPR